MLERNGNGATALHALEAAHVDQRPLILQKTAEGLVQIPFDVPIDVFTMHIASADHLVVVEVGLCCFVG